MRYTQYIAFDKHLQSAFPSNFSSLYCLIIKDSAERSLAFDRLKKKIGGEFVAVYSSDPQGEKELLSALDALSLFSERQLIHLQFCEKLSKGTIHILEKKLSNLSPQMTLVLSGETLSRQGSFYKALEKHGVILDIGEEKTWEKEKNLAEWLLERVRESGKSMDVDAVNTLARGAQGSLAFLSAEWEKLLTYVGEGSQIGMTHVRSICCLTSIDSSWLLGESVLAKDSKTALEAAFRMLDQGVSIFPLLRGLRHQIMTALLLSSAEREGKREWIAQKFPYLKGSMLEKQLHTALSFGTGRLARAIQVIDDFEFRAKDSLDDPKLLLTLLCTRIIP